MYKKNKAKQGARRPKKNESKKKKKVCDVDARGVRDAV